SDFGPGLRDLSEMKRQAHAENISLEASLSYREEVAKFRQKRKLLLGSKAAARESFKKELEDAAEEIGEGAEALGRADLGPRLKAGRLKKREAAEILAKVRSLEREFRKDPW